MDESEEKFVPYPRGPAPYGSAEKLRALAEGYFNLNWVSVLNLVLGFVVVAASFGTFQHGGPQLLIGVTLLGIVMGLFAFPCVKKIGFGLDWSPFKVRLCTFILVLNSLFCCGVFGYLILQQTASAEMRRYGLTGTLLGMNRREVAKRVAEMEGTTAEAILGQRKR